MVLFFVGLGLGDEKDITVRGLEVVRKSERVYLEAYTAILGIGQERLEAFYGKKLILADRTMVEQNSSEIIRGADKADVAFLVVGDALAATTHHDLMLRAIDEGVTVQVIHNASIMNACASSGLQLYNFGQTISIPFFDGNWRPDSFYDKIKVNMDAGLHTLCLLDIKVKEQSVANMVKGLAVFDPPRYMSINQAIEQLLEIEEKRKLKVCGKDVMCIGMARVGQSTAKTVSGSMEEVLKIDFGSPLHSIVIPGPVLHDIEKNMFEFFHWNREARKEQLKKDAADQESQRVKAMEERLAEMRLRAAQKKSGVKQLSAGDDDDSDDDDAKATSSSNSTTSSSSSSN